MKKSKEIIRLHKLTDLSQRQIANAMGVSRPVVSKAIERWEASGRNWEELQEMKDSEFHELLYPQERPPGKADKLREKFPEYAKELKRVGVTLQLLWEEYLKENPEGLKYSRFCYHFQKWKEDDAVSMHLEHIAGDKMFVDYAGKRREIIDPKTGEKTFKEVFVAILPASQLTYVEATDNQKKESFILSVERAIRYFGGVPGAIVPDNLKSAVVKPSFYEPEINPLLEDFACHYQTAILPARSGKPKDKAHVENAVKISYSRIFAPMRNQVFHSTEDLNKAIWAKLEEHNHTKLTKMEVSRWELFQDVEKKALRNLPIEKYPLKYFQDNTKVQFNYHVYLKEDKHYYSAPYLLKGKKIRIIYDETHVTLYHDNVRVWQHKRDRRKNKYTTEAEHMPRNHRFFQDWSPEKFRWLAGNVGEDTVRVVDHLLKTKVHPEQAYRTCLGVLNLTQKFSTAVVNQACRNASNEDWISYKRISEEAERIDKAMEEAATDSQLCLIPTDHENIRGEKYYQ